MRHTFLAALAFAATIGAPAHAQVIGPIDYEVAAALRSGKTAIRLPGPIIDSIAFDTLADLLHYARPVVVTVVTRAAAVEPARHEDIRTYYLARVENNILGRDLPAFDASQCPASMDVSEAEKPAFPYLCFQLIGGLLTYKGVEVTFGSTGRELSVKGRYLLFLGPTASGGPLLLRTDGSDCLRIVNGLLSRTGGSRISPVASLDKMPLAQAESFIQVANR